MLRAVLFGAAVASAASLQQPILSQPHSTQNGASEEWSRASASPIFNALHSSMRQWGSSLNHNGMSFFPATIPAGTDFYHGTHGFEPVTGTEWLAFEIEHAEVFARNFRGRPGGSDPGHSPPGGHEPPSVFSGAGSTAANNSAALHHYRAAHDLRVLYIDGMAAGKTSLGTLDTQDYLLCNVTEEERSTKVHEDDVKRPAGPWSEAQRASQMCEELGDSIEGIVRLEMGFELILCNFSKDATFISATARPQSIVLEPVDELRVFEYVRGVSMRYHGITARRVEVDYSNMVSAYFYNVNLTNPDPTRSVLPRLHPRDKDMLAHIKSDLIQTLDRKDKGKTIDWQSVTDLIVTRYTDRLQFMVGLDTTHRELLSELSFLLNVFIDYTTSTPDIAAANQKCTTHYLNRLQLSTESDQLIHTAISAVTSKICTTLLEARTTLLASGFDEKADVEAVKLKINGLTEWLGWTTWLECGKCRYDEVCFVAMWPMGGVREHEHPHCTKIGDVNGRRGYWGGRGPGGGGGGDGRGSPPPMEL